MNQTSYARVLSGEIPILVDADFNANRGRFKDKANVVFVMPQEGSLPVPYTIVLTKNAPHLENAKKVADFLLSDKGQAGWANGFLRPVRPSAMSKETADRLFPAGADYARLKTVDFGKFADAQKPFATRYLADVTLRAPGRSRNDVRMIAHRGDRETPWLLLLIAPRGGGLPRLLAAADRRG